MSLQDFPINFINNVGDFHFMSSSGNSMSVEMYT
jgi:hypothetical protein